MQITVEGVSATGLVAADKWYNGDKAASLEFKDKVFKGDVVELTMNAKGFVTSYTVVTSAPPKPKFEKKSWGGSSQTVDPERSAKMSRGAAVKAVLSSPLIVELYKDYAPEQALKESFKLSEQVASYIEKGI